MNSSSVDPSTTIANGSRAAAKEVLLPELRGGELFDPGPILVRVELATLGPSIAKIQYDDLVQVERVYEPW